MEFIEDVDPCHYHRTVVVVPIGKTVGLFVTRLRPCNFFLTLAYTPSFDAQHWLIPTKASHLMVHIYCIHVAF